MTARSLDTLSCSGELFLMFSWLGLNHKQCYRFVFVTTVLASLIFTIIGTTVIIALGLYINVILCKIMSFTYA